MLIETSQLLAKAREMVESAGINNVVVDEDQLVMCGVHYVVEACGCGDADCDGVRLKQVTNLPPLALQ
jgi:predicted site-specific integrase-resolvase